MTYFIRGAKSYLLLIILLVFASTAPCRCASLLV
ncbi:hypothetical protein Sinme_5822 [Sinorhizobium meliloti AK83]|nr:hypothetical protein SinmeB_6105 [Sinorhizobium meliloti BL225C]AEG57354.1 hypothetical protein Sinme_5822 [Sinorhizobium meliloti AK83]